MIDVFYTKTFLKKFSKLDPSLQEEVYDKIELFKYEENHQKLKVHKLRKPFEGRYAFSVNYRIRVIFIYDEKNKNRVYLLTVGTHDQVYRSI